MTQHLMDVEYSTWDGIKREWYFDDDTDELICHKTSDVTRMLDYNKSLAAEQTDFSSKTKFHKMASIPPIVEMELLKKGIDLKDSDPAMRKRLYQEIEQNYPHLKTHSKKLWRPT